MPQTTETMKYPININPAPYSRVGDVDFDNIPFGRVYADHMFIADYDRGAWGDARIVPFENISMPPTISALHYGQIIFEGMKAYSDDEGNAIIFRPLQNQKRFNTSAERMAMPQVSEELFMSALTELIRLDKEWVPKNNNSLYIRPFMFATEEYIGVKPAERFRFMIFTSPVGAYYNKPVRVLVSQNYVRAFKGGTGYAKAAGNYAATMYPVKQANKAGYDQLLWLDGCEFKYVHEIGTMNVFFIIDGTVVTPTIEEGEILDGVTRDSAIKLLRDKGHKVEVRKITFDEVYDAHKKGVLEDAFGTGTAATIAHIAEFGYNGENLMLPPVEERTISNELGDELDMIKRGRIDDKYNWLYKVIL